MFDITSKDRPLSVTAVVLVVAASLLSSCSNRPAGSTSPVGGTALGDVEHHVLGHELVFGKSGKAQSVPTGDLIQAGDAISQLADSLPDSHIWIGGELTVDLAGSKARVEGLQSRVAAAAHQIAGLVLNETVTYSEDVFTRRRAVLEPGSTSMVTVGPWLASPSTSLDQVATTIARHFARLPVRALIVKRIVLTNGALVIVVHVIPNASVRLSQYPSIGVSCARLLLDEAYSAGAKSALQALGPIPTSTKLA